MVSALNNEKIPENSDVVYIPGGYTETPEVASFLNDANIFKESLKTIANNANKKIFAECAGLMFLGERIQTTEGGWINGTGLLPLNFEMQSKRSRLGYYKAIDMDNLNIYKGHSFHYSKATELNDNIIKTWGFFKDKDSKATVGAWSNQNKNVFGTYLHSFFYNQPEIVLKYFNPNT